MPENEDSRLAPPGREKQISGSSMTSVIWELVSPEEELMLRHGDIQSFRSRNLATLNDQSYAPIHPLTKTRTEPSPGFLNPLRAQPLQKFFFVKIESYYTKVNIEEIYLIEDVGHSILIHTKKKCYDVRATIYKTLTNLPKTEFARVHNSFIVRIDKISAIEDNLLLVEDRLIPLSLAYRQEVMARLNIL